MPMTATPRQNSEQRPHLEIRRPTRPSATTRGCSTTPPVTPLGDPLSQELQTTWADGLRTFHGRPGCIAARHRFMATTPQGPGLQSFGKESPSGVQLNWPEALPRGPAKSDARMFKPVTLQAVAHQVAKTEHDQPGWCIFPDGAMDWTHDDRLGPPLQWAALRLFHLTPHRLRGRQ